MIWYPYCQMKTAPLPLKVFDAHGVTLNTEQGPLIDSIASWWSVIYGYGQPSLVSAIKDQADKLSHVMFGGLTHEPAQKLAAALESFCPGRLNHVFFSDSGSVAVEVALKMARQAHQNQGDNRPRVLALQNAYHGDTFKTMEVGDDSTYHHAFPEKRDVSHMPATVQGLLDGFEQWANESHCLIVEPLLQGAGGMSVYDLEVLKVARELCNKHHLTLIFDEVATGFGRTGYRFVSDVVEPDILVLGKALTAGMLGHACTIASDDVFRCFWDDDPRKALMHGPTFMANPLACAVALAGLELFGQVNVLQQAARLGELALSALQLDSPLVKEVRVLGAMACVEVTNSEHLKGYQAFAAQRGVFARPFGCTLYAMPAYVMTDEEFGRVLDTMKAWFSLDGEKWRQKNGLA